MTACRACDGLIIGAAVVDESERYLPAEDASYWCSESCRDDTASAVASESVGWPRAPKSDPWLVSS